VRVYTMRPDDTNRFSNIVRIQAACEDDRDLRLLNNSSAYGPVVRQARRAESACFGIEGVENNRIPQGRFELQRFFHRGLVSHGHSPYRVNPRTEVSEVTDLILGDSAVKLERLAPGVLDKLTSRGRGLMIRDHDGQNVGRELLDNDSRLIRGETVMESARQFQGETQGVDSDPVTKERLLK